jgi:hypothetical protein
VLILLAVTAGGFSLRAGADDRKVADADYFPQTIGATWRATMMFRGEARGQQIGTCLVGTEKIRGNVYVKRVMVMDGVKHESYERVTDKGIFGFMGPNKAMAPICFMQFPLKIGKAWVVPLDPGCIGEYSILGRGDVAAGGKLYKNCLHVRMVHRYNNAPPAEPAAERAHVPVVITSDMWLAPGVGAVKSETRAVIPGREPQRSTTVLKSFKVVKDPKREVKRLEAEVNHQNLKPMLPELDRDE